jgi:HD superfamily phosphodiesterase
MGGRTWQQVCIEMAERRAGEEAVLLWRWDAHSTPVPFAHRWEHVQEVVRLALWLAAAEGASPAQTLVIEAAAWLHDIRKLEPHHAAVAAAEAPALLAATDFPPALIPAVAAAIAQHEGMTRPPGAPPLASLEAAVLWDADKLSKLGVGALMLSMAAPYDAGKAPSERRTRAALFTRTTLAKTVESMNTATARAEARRRYAAMLAALDAWEREADPASAPAPPDLVPNGG